MFWRFLAVPVCVAMLSVSAWGQEQGRGERGERGDRGGDRRGNFEQFRQRAAERLKEQLQVSDEEWKVLEPKIEKVTTLRLSSAGGFGGMMMMMGGRGGEGRGGQDNSEVGRTSRELREVLANDNASPEEIKKRLEAYRAARSKADEELKTAREELRELLTQRQEAVLVMAQILE